MPGEGHGPDPSRLQCSTINRSGPGGDEGVYLLEIPRARQLPGIRRLWVYSLAPWPVNPALLGRTQLELRYHTERVQGGDTATGLFSLSSLCPIINKKKRVSEITRNKLQMSGIFKQMFLSVRPGIDQVFSRRRPGPLPSRCMQQLAATRCG